MSDSNGKYITVQEALIYTGKSYSTIYRYLKKGKLNGKKLKLNGELVTMLEKEELTRVFQLSETQVSFNGNSGETQDTFNETQVKLTETHLKGAIKTVIEEYFQDRETKMMKPVEEMAVYKVGQLEERLRNIEKEKELILQENENFRSQLKALPGPPGEIIEKLEQIEAELSSKLETFQAEQDELQSRLQAEEKEKQLALQQKEELERQRQEIAREKEEALQRTQEKKQELQEKEIEIQTIQNEKTAALQQKEQAIEELAKEKEQLQTEKEAAMKELQQQKEAEAQTYQKKIEEKEQEEKDLMATVEEMKKRLEEEEKKSWWQKLIGG